MASGLGASRGRGRNGVPLERPVAGEENLRGAVRRGGDRGGGAIQLERRARRIAQDRRREDSVGAVDDVGRGEQRPGRSERQAGEHGEVDDEGALG